MNTTFTCPHCGLASEIDPAHIGKSGPCRGCGKEVTVPLPKEASLPPTASSRGSSTPWIVGCAVIGVLGLVGLAILGCAGIALFGVRTQQMQMQQEAVRAEEVIKLSVEAQEEARKAMQEAERSTQEVEKSLREMEEKAKEAEERVKEMPPTNPPSSTP